MRTWEEGARNEAVLLYEVLKDIITQTTKVEFTKALTLPATSYLDR